MLKALILCGGKSSRMGKDKGSLLHEGKTWAELAESKAKEAGLEVLVSVNENQVDQYSKVFAKEQLVVDSFPGVEGPMKGLLSVHKAFPAADFLVLACDMIDIHMDDIEQLRKGFYSRKTEYSVFEQDGLHPFPGIYSSNFLKWLYNFYIIGNLKDYSLIRRLKNEDGLILKRDEFPERLNNINSPQELNPVLVVRPIKS